MKQLILFLVIANVISFVIWFLVFYFWGFTTLTIIIFILYIIFNVLGAIRVNKGFKQRITGTPGTPVNNNSFNKLISNDDN